MDSVTPAAEAANPFEGLEEAFAADQAEERIEFRLFDRDCFVLLRPMDADADARFRSRGQKQTFQVNSSQPDAVTPITLETDHSVREIELLLGTVIDFALPKRSKARTGDDIVTMSMGNTMTRQQKEQVLRGLSREFRARLVKECVRVNHMDDAAPLAPAAGEKESKPSSKR